MNYKKIDLEQWNRKEHFLHYRHNLQCGFSLTTKIDITVLKTVLTGVLRPFPPNVPPIIIIQLILKKNLFLFFTHFDFSF